MKTSNGINKKIKLNRGMTYVELIVVLSIFAALSTVVVFNYANFEAKVDLKNLASDVALQIVQAQRSSLSGFLPTQTPGVSPWKPSYGVYFSSTGSADASGGDNKHFVYFVDLSNNKTFDGSSCPTAVNECLSKYAITKSNNISDIRVVYVDNSFTVLSNLTITFTRPDALATFRSTTAFSGLTVSYVQITIISPKGTTSLIRTYPSGRVEID